MRREINSHIKTSSFQSFISTVSGKQCRSQLHFSNSRPCNLWSSPPPAPPPPPPLPSPPLSSMAQPRSHCSRNPVPLLPTQSQSPLLSSLQSGLWGRFRAASCAPLAIRPWLWRWCAWLLTPSTRGVLGRRRSSRLMTLITSSRLGTSCSWRRADPLARPRLLLPSHFPEGIPRMPWLKRVETRCLGFQWSLRRRKLNSEA